MPLPDAAVRRLTARHQRNLERLALTGEKIVGQAWHRLESWEDADVRRLARLAGPAMAELNERAAASTAAYLAAVLETPTRSTSIRVEPAWRDPFIAMRTSLGHGRPFDEALVAGFARAGAAGSNAVISTARRAADQAAGDDVVGWTRTVSAGACDWCSAVAGATYYSAESADFGHDRCACGVAPIPA
jgi:hypothetical protein